MLHPPPVHLSAPSTGSWIFTVLCLAIFVIALGWSVARAARGDWLALACLAGGLIANLIEAELDNLGLLWFARNNHLIVFHSFGRFMPLYVTLGYGFYFGAITYFTLDGLRRGRGARYLWAIYAFGWVFDCALETTGSAVGLYKYYGPQPYNIWSIPLWWMFVNPALPIAAGGLFHVMRRRLAGVRALLVVPLLPMCYGATYGALAWPIFVALNSHVRGWVIWIAGTVTPAFCLLYVWLIITGLEWYRRAHGVGSVPEPVPAAPPALVPVSS
jgi:cytochrome c oxidase subunit IV